MDLALLISIIAFLFGGGILVGIVRLILKIGGFSATLRNLEENISEIKDNCKSMWEILSKHGASIEGLMVHTKYGLQNSPIVPNVLGKQLLEKSGFDAIYPEIKDDIFTLMDSYNLRTLYDYERGAEKALEALRDNPLMDRIKNYSVNNASEPLELIFRVASWIVRDDYDKYKKNAHAPTS